jgi:hypothetical protein
VAEPRGQDEPGGAVDGIHTRPLALAVLQLVELVDLVVGDRPGHDVALAVDRGDPDEVEIG